MLISRHDIKEFVYLALINHEHHINSYIEIIGAHIFYY